MKMDKHVNYIGKKEAKKVGFLARISLNLGLKERIKIYKTIVAPHFEYCASILFLCNKQATQKLQKIQNRAMRVILRCNRRTRIKDVECALLDGCKPKNPFPDHYVHILNEKQHAARIFIIKTLI